MKSYPKLRYYLIEFMLIRKDHAFHCTSYPYKTKAVLINPNKRDSYLKSIVNQPCYIIALTTTEITRKQYRHYMDNISEVYKAPTALIGGMPIDPSDPVLPT